MVASVEGLSYSELRSMPLSELKLVRDEVVRIADLRAKGARDATRRGKR